MGSKSSTHLSGRSFFKRYPNIGCQFTNIMKLIVTLAAFAGFSAQANTVFQESGKANEVLRTRRETDVIDLTNLDNKNKAAQKFLANLERECVEEQCGLEEAIETYEEFGASAAAQVISGDQSKYDQYVNEYVSAHIKANNLRESLEKQFQKFYVDCHEKFWKTKHKNERNQAPALTDVQITSASDNDVKNGFVLKNHEGSFLEALNTCIKAKGDNDESVENFLSKIFNIWMYEYVEGASAN